MLGPQDNESLVVAIRYVKRDLFAHFGACVSVAGENQGKETPAYNVKAVHEWLLLTRGDGGFNRSRDIPAAKGVSRAYGGSLVIPVREVANRRLILGAPGFETSTWLSLVLRPLDVFIKKNFLCVTRWWLSSVSAIPFVSLFSHISPVSAFDASARSSSSLSLELQPSGMSHGNG